MPSNKRAQLLGDLPDSMVTEVVNLRDLGSMVAAKNDLPAGHYELVIEYKFGPARLPEPDGSGSVGAMGVTFGGLGLRKAEKPSPMTIEVKSSSTTHPRKRTGRKRA